MLPDVRRGRAGGRDALTGDDDRTEGDDIALNSEAKDGTELEKPGKARHSKANRESHAEEVAQETG